MIDENLIKGYINTDCPMSFVGLNNLVSKVHGLVIVQSINKLIDFAHSLLNNEATDYKNQVNLTGNDRRAYCVEYGDYYEVYIETQSSYYAYKLRGVTLIPTSIRDFNLLKYSARRINHNTYCRGDAYKKYFTYYDCRDKGYAGTYNFANQELDNGLYFTNEIKTAFELIYYEQVES